ncbi:hypothetical protein C8Q79DRAFT_983792 [Trametes meyenii]|nr:hypothetical protein C8Q79DRAFT_983792 [Trametes meyenii]
MAGKHRRYHGGLFRYMHSPYTEDRSAQGNPCSATGARDVVEYFAKASKYPDGPREDMIQKLVVSFHSDSNPSRFTHGDLIPENILVDPANENITSIIGWEWAGWYPYFWDHFIALRRLGTYDDNADKCKNWKIIFSLVFGDVDERIEETVVAISRAEIEALLRGYERRISPGAPPFTFCGGTVYG